MSSDPKPPGEMMKYLPPIFHEDQFLAEYLRAFERILVGSGDRHIQSLEEIIARVARYFSPKDAPEEFLPWLAGWMAFGLRADLSVSLKREFLTKIISLYKKRGTKESMRKLLKVFTGAEPTILEGDDLDDPNNAHWNVDDGFKKWAVSDEKPEHAFGVLLSFMAVEGSTDRSAAEIKRKLAIASALIELEKPAHTIFYLIPIFPSLKLPKFSTEGRIAREIDPEARSSLGFDTLLGTRSPTDATAPLRVAKPKPQKLASKKPQAQKLTPRKQKTRKLTTRKPKTEIPKTRKPKTELESKTALGSKRKGEPRGSRKRK